MNIKAIVSNTNTITFTTKKKAWEDSSSDYCETPKEWFKDIMEAIVTPVTHIIKKIQQYIKINGKKIS